MAGGAAGDGDPPYPSSRTGADRPRSCRGCGGPDSLLSRVHTGTLDYAAWLTAPAALAYQRRIDRAARAARLRALRDRWVARARQVPGITVLTPDDPALHGAITSFRIDGVTSAQGNAELAKRLLDRHRVFTVHRTGPAKGACIRVTPALFTSMAEVDRLAAALPDLVASFLLAPRRGERLAKDCVTPRSPA
ncbi:hypothetical protein GCM10020258_35760 [Sphingomonas yabuuchiae]